MSASGDDAVARSYMPIPVLRLELAQSRVHLFRLAPHGTTVISPSWTMPSWIATLREDRIRPGSTRSRGHISTFGGTSP